MAKYFFVVFATFFHLRKYGVDINCLIIKYSGGIDNQV